MFNHPPLFFSEREWMIERVPELTLVNICPLLIWKSFVILALSFSCKPQSTQERLTEGYSKLSAFKYGNSNSSILVEALRISEKTPQMWRALRSQWEAQSVTQRQIEKKKQTLCVRDSVFSVFYYRWQEPLIDGTWYYVIIYFLNPNTAKRTLITRDKILSRTWCLADSQTPKPTTSLF